MIGFSFLTQVPLEDYVDIEQSKAFQTNERNTKMMTKAISNELQLKIKEQQMRKKLDQVLYR